MTLIEITEQSIQVAEHIAGRTTQIATLPEVTVRIIELVQDPKSTAADLHNIVQNDPALSARILKVVNSAFYGLPGQIASLERAIMMLGLNAVKNIAIAASLTRLLKQGAGCQALNGRGLWVHSVAVGSINRMLAMRMGMPAPDEAFLSGLIHDLGLVAILQHFSDQLPDMARQAQSGTPFAEIEMGTIGTSHELIGMMISKYWKFPKSLQLVTGYHHRPLELPEKERTMATLCHVAEFICKQNAIGQDITCDDDSPAPVDCFKELGIDIGITESIKDELTEELSTVRAMIE